VFFQKSQEALSEQREIMGEWAEGIYNGFKDFILSKPKENTKSKLD
jgi:hypothetical protein